MIEALASRVDLELITIYLKRKMKQYSIISGGNATEETNLKVLNHMESGRNDVGQNGREEKARTIGQRKR